MIELTDIIEYADVRVGYLKIQVGEKMKKYRALWMAKLPHMINGNHCIPAGTFPVRFDYYRGVVNNPFVYFNKTVKSPIYPFGSTSFDEMFPYIYIQHSDGTVVSRDEWKKVSDITFLYCNTIRIEEPAVKVLSKEFLDKSKTFDLENW